MKFVYYMSCIDANGEAIQQMQDEATDVSLFTIRKHCEGVRDWERSMQYESDKRNGLTLREDWHVGYGKSRYRGVPCYFIQHSRIEYIWVPPDKLDFLRAMQDADTEDLDTLEAGADILARVYKEAQSERLQGSTNAGENCGGRDSNDLQGVGRCPKSE
jgi:hypothetical protein